MKKLPSLLLAVVSTMLLLVGAARAADSLDPLATSSTPTNFSDSVLDGPGNLCAGGGEEETGPR